MTGELPEVSFECTVCADCCKDVPGHRRRILILGNEIAAIERESRLERKAFSRRSGRRDSYKYRMKKTGGSCFFLGADRLCRIYRKRPLVCRFYPFELSPDGNWGVSRSCEGIGCGEKVQEKHFKGLVSEARRRFSGKLG
ncbi:MAG: YkgJ family cysteine cluster protein [archaeon]